MKNNRYQRYFFLVPLAVGVYLLSRLVSLVWGVNLTLEHGFFLLMVLATFVFRLEARFNVAAGLLILSFSPLLLIFRNEAGADKAAVFAFLLLTLGVLQQVWGQLSVKKTSPQGPPTLAD